MKLTTPWTASTGNHNGTAKLDGMRDVARDAQKQTNGAMKRFAAMAATWGPTFAAIGQQRMRRVGERAQSLGHELRQVRLTTEPKQSASSALPGIALIGGLGIGIGIGLASMYLLDPERGQRRRRILRARWNRLIGVSRQDKVGVMAFGESGGSGNGILDQQLVREEISYETWPEGTRVPTA